MELRQMIMTISQLQSSGLPGAVIYDYFDKITFVLTDKSPENGVFRMLARLDFMPNMEPTEVPSESGMKIIKFYHREETSGLATVDFHGPILGTLMDIDGCWFHNQSYISNEVGAHFTIVGTKKALSAYRKRMLALFPEDIGLKVSSSMRADFMMTPSLSKRQSEVLSVAVQMGYYGQPKKCNQSDIAEVIGISQGTVAEHLQLAESNIMSGWFRQIN
ncbi:MAG: hypothetical protein CMB16_04450 [Euryarchaeota archaeon]|nr:hypothetical protein [Euryarchaeota archaeon]